MTQIERKPFDPADIFDAVSESFRLQTVNMMLEADKAAIFLDLPHERKLVAFMAGVLTGFCGVCMAFVTEEGRDEFFEEVVRYLPEARLNAEEIASHD